MLAIYISIIKTLTHFQENIIANFTEIKTAKFKNLLSM